MLKLTTRTIKLDTRLNQTLVLVFALILLCSCNLQKKQQVESKPQELVIFSPHPEEIITYIVREFRQRTGIPVRIVMAGTGELINKLKQGSTEADLFWGGGIESLETIVQYFEPIQTSEMAYINPSYISTHSLWLPFSVLPIVIIYNKSLISKELWPTKWNDLLSPRFRNRLIMADPEKSGSAFTILATLLYTMKTNQTDVFGGWPYIQELLPQLGREGIASASSMVFNSVASGDFYAGITFENYALSLEKTGSNVGYCYPQEGTSALPDGIALLKTAHNKEAALLFIDFVLSPEVQKLLLPKWQRRSVRTDIEASDPSLQGHIIRYPVAKAASSRDSILDQWKQLKETSKNFSF